MITWRALTLFEIILRITLAVTIGGALGYERGLKNRPAGLRTYILVCTGAAIVMITNQYIYQSLGNGDPVRMGAQVVSGIGFLGAGTIIVTPHNQIKGLTTAAGLWASACVGLAIGIGFYEVAIVGGVTIYVVFSLMQHWDALMKKRSNVIEVYVELSRSIHMGTFIRQLHEKEIEFSDLHIEKELEAVDEIVCFVVTLKGIRGVHRDDIVRIVKHMDGVEFVKAL